MALFQWGRWYRNIMDMPATERPDDATIDDDFKVDRWFKQYVSDQARKSSRHGSGNPAFSFAGQQERPQAVEVYSQEQMRRPRGQDPTPGAP